MKRTEKTCSTCARLPLSGLPEPCRACLRFKGRPGWRRMTWLHQLFYRLLGWRA